MAKMKISLKTKIKSYTKKKGKGLFGISIGNVKLIEAHRNSLDHLIDDADEVTLTIELAQEKLPGME